MKKADLDSNRCLIVWSVELSMILTHENFSFSKVVYDNKISLYREEPYQYNPCTFNLKQ